ncbi:MAG: hypothetical protein JO224_06040 [Pelomonas sp.]|nr:hypothetical protein [Roseateles sp.]
MSARRRLGRALRVAALALLVPLGAVAADAPSAAPASAPLGMVEQPCAGTPPDAHGDWAGLCRYAADDARLLAAGKHPRVVFLGDSITELWAQAEPALFDGDTVVGRGISGQTSAQMLVRLHADVVDLHPQIVHIMAGTNDVAGNGGPTSEAAWRNNIMAMVEIAQAHGIEVVLASIPPAARFGWRPGIAPAAQIVRLNGWLRAYAERMHLRYVDYYPRLATPDGAMRPEFSPDGVHPNQAGYAAMRPLAAALR